MIPSIESLIADVLSIPLAGVADDLAYQSISEWDSFQHVTLMLALEEALNIQIDGDLTLRLTSVARIKEFVRLRGEAGGQAEVPQEGEVTAPPVVQRGLEGVVFDRSRISLIDGHSGELLYRGYMIQDLLANSTFEETVFLLLHGRLPTADELQVFDQELRAARRLPASVLDVIYTVRDAEPMDALRTAISALNAFDRDRGDNSLAATRRKGLRLIAQMPALVGSYHCMRTGRPATAPAQSLSHAAYLLYMLTGAVPSEQATRLVDKDLILHAEHGSNASAFAARVVTSTRAGVHAAVTAAVAAFSGQLHGGAIENVVNMLSEIGEPQNVSHYVRSRLSRNEPIMGFGHRVYRVEDPRARHLRQAAYTLSTQSGQTKWFDIVEAIVQQMSTYGRHGVHPNVDLYAGVIYHLLGIPGDLSVPLFAVGRIAGWVAHVLEQADNNVLIRPLLRYEGARGLTYITADRRVPTLNDSERREAHV